MILWLFWSQSTCCIEEGGKKAISECSQYGQHKTYWPVCEVLDMQRLGVLHFIIILGFWLTFSGSWPLVTVLSKAVTQLRGKRGKRTLTARIAMGLNYPAMNIIIM